MLNVEYGDELAVNAGDAVLRSAALNVVVRADKTTAPRRGGRIGDQVAAIRRPYRSTSTTLSLYIYVSLKKHNLI
jgi:hypothetical protein